MLTDRLKAVLEGVEHLSPEAQDRLAEEIADLLDEARWDAQFADPASRAFFDEMARQAEQGPYRLWPVPDGWTEADESHEKAADDSQRAAESGEHAQ
jgi:hypothetical protein